VLPALLGTPTLDLAALGAASPLDPSKQGETPSRRLQPRCRPHAAPFRIARVENGPAPVEFPRRPARASLDLSGPGQHHHERHPIGDDTEERRLGRPDIRPPPLDDSTGRACGLRPRASELSVSVASTPPGEPLPLTLRRHRRAGGVRSSEAFRRLWQRHIHACPNAARKHVEAPTRPAPRRLGSGALCSRPHLGESRLGLRCSIAGVPFSAHVRVSTASAQANPRGR